MKNIALITPTGSASLARLLYQILALALALNLALPLRAQAPSEPRLAGLDTLAQRLLAEWQAPGVGIAVIEKGKIVYAGGFGYRDYEGQKPVTGQTLFAIGSSTKAFTSALLGKLQAEGKLDFDKKVRDYLPGFRFYNDDLDRLATVRDLTCHRTGLPRHDFSWYLNPTTRDSLLLRIQHFEPSAELREKWQYNNFMFLLQGAIAEKITGKSWEDNIREHFFQPLGMKASNFALWKGKHAEPALGYYTDKDKAIKPMPYYEIDGMGPAGSIFSSPAEMANWALAWTNGGIFEGQEIIPAGYWREAISSQMAVGAGLPSPENPDAFLSNYGMGWFLTSYRGHYRVEHGGNIDGFSASVGFFPSDSLGIVVLANQNGSRLPGLLRNYIADWMLGLPARDWHGQAKAAATKAEAAEEEAKAAKADERKKGTRPTHLLAELAGNYEHPGYGSLLLFVRNDSLFARTGALDMWAEHYHYNVFMPRPLKDGFDVGDDSPFRFHFNVGLQGDIESLTFAGIEAGIEDIKFKRQATKVAVSKEELEAYVGEYELAGMTAKVYLRSETLMVFVPGQPDYETVPIGAHQFKLKALDGFSVRFEMGPDGKAAAVFFVQPNGTFRAARKA
jgi:CubicO group peptidase (beta-lactamase class C family)